MEEYLSKNTRPAMVSYKTSNNRGYIGTWTIKENKLYLTHLIPDPKENKGYSIDEIFKKTPPILAEWFSGIIYFRLGKIVGYEGFTPQYDKIEEVTIKNGIIVKRKVKNYNKSQNKYY